MKFLNFINKENAKDTLSKSLFKAIYANSIIVFVKIFSSFIVSKVTAVFLGPSGYALVGNFKNVIQGVLGVTTTGFESGVIKYVSENKTNKDKLVLILANIFFLNLILCIAVFIVLFYFSDSISLYTLKTIDYAYVFKYLAILLPLLSFNFICLYIANGLQKIKIYTILVCVFNLLNGLVVFCLVYYYNLKGALLSSLIVPSVSFFTVFFFREIRELIFCAFKSINNISVVILKNMSTYIFMSIYSALLLSFNYLFIRNAIIENLNINMAGYWEALNKISMFYMMFFSSLFTLYLLPKLTTNKTTLGYKNIMLSYFKVIIPLMGLAFFLLFIFKYNVIELFLTKDFLPIANYFYLQLVADFIKVIAFSFAYQFHAKKITTYYLISDTVLYVSFYFLSINFLPKFELFGVLYGYLISIILYLIAVCLFLFVFRKNKLSNHE
ncbi:O-antigen translocase [Neotamlana laminarinivorans]|uniref:O-antigen translocase n=1 Tax=Neotamlana laminarinivorans TaxID=2883124 RepID=A0A9X1I0F1_9FLAO|nr:O-antigen translocase [Tamlana laminarinivorans]MCB4799523.1 O-antigen translocase [Tamlana laminarinivorans]